jgi:hypothetical protein
MAAKDTKTKPTQEEIDYAGAEFSTFILEDEEDSRAMNFSMTFAVIAHIVLLFMPLVSFSQIETAEKKDKKLYVVQQVRFQPPPPKQKKEIPKPKAKKVPIPDPTPDEPEPIRIDEPEPDIDIPDVSDIVFGIPDAPPVAEPEGPIHVGGDVKPPVKLQAPQPQYTEIARKARVQGGGHRPGHHRQGRQRDQRQGSQGPADGSRRGSCQGDQAVEVRGGDPQRQAGRRVLQPDGELPASIAETQSMAFQLHGLSRVA